MLKHIIFFILALDYASSVHLDKFHKLRRRFGGSEDDCTTYTITIPTENNNINIHVPDTCLNYDIDIDKDPSCTNGFPMECTYQLKFNGALDHAYSNSTKDSLILKQSIKDSLILKQSIKDSLISKQSHSVAQLFNMNKSQAQFMQQRIFSALKKKKYSTGEKATFNWAAKAFRKMAMDPKKCKPGTGSKKVRHLDCDLCWTWGFIPRPCNCNCRGWNNFLGLCYQPCRELAPKTLSSGLYCHTPCDRDGQKKLTKSCGLGHDRVCVTDGWQCAVRIYNRILTPFEILKNVLTGGILDAIKNVAKNAVSKGAQIGFSKFIDSVLDSSNEEIKKAKRYFTSSFRKFGYSDDDIDNILKNGLIIFVGSNMHDLNGVDIAWDILEIADPTGIVGFGKDFIPPTDCDEVDFYSDPPRKCFGCTFTNIIGSATDSPVTDSSGCLKEENIDFNGNDIKSEIVDGVDACATWCGQTTTCKVWTMAKSNKLCWLKTSDSGRMQSSNRISGTKSCSTGCLKEDNIDFNGNDIKSEIVDGVDACATWCGQTTTCKVWTMAKSNNRCWLKTSDSGRMQSSDRISGTKSCSTGRLQVLSETNDLDDSAKFNQYWNKGAIICRDCESCILSHREICYKRLTEPFDAAKNGYDLFTTNWFSGGNTLHQDFELYSSLENAQSDKEKWNYCNYNDPGIGFPRDCGPVKAIGWQWNSKNRGGQSVRFWTIGKEYIG